MTAKERADALKKAGVTVKSEPQGGLTYYKDGRLLDQATVDLILEGSGESSGSPDTYASDESTPSLNNPLPKVTGKEVFGVIQSAFSGAYNVFDTSVNILYDLLTGRASPASVSGHLKTAWDRSFLPTLSRALTKFRDRDEVGKKLAKALAEDASDEEISNITRSFGFILENGEWKPVVNQGASGGTSGETPPPTRVEGMSEEDQERYQQGLAAEAGHTEKTRGYTPTLPYGARPDIDYYNRSAAAGQHIRDTTGLDESSVPKTAAAQRTEYFQRMAERLQSQRDMRGSTMTFIPGMGMVGRAAEIYQMTPNIEIHDKMEQAQQLALQGKKEGYQQLDRIVNADEVLKNIAQNGALSMNDIEKLRKVDDETLIQTRNLNVAAVEKELDRLAAGIPYKEDLQHALAKMKMSITQLSMFFDVAIKNGWDERIVGPFASAFGIQAPSPILAALSNWFRKMAGWNSDQFAERGEQSLQEMWNQYYLDQGWTPPIAGSSAGER